MSAFYLYTDIPGSGKGWTLAVFATSRKDANDYIKAVHHHGKFVRSVTSGNVDANCGATTDEARMRMRSET